ncbi:MAG: hypothetical protein ACM3SY_20285 [Candidatus Omnitrophota bacterium]
MGIKQIFHDGMKELKRRGEVHREKRDFKEKERVLDEQMTRLGQKTWELKIDISGYGNLAGALAAIQQKEETLKAQMTDLTHQMQVDEDKKKERNTYLDSERELVEEKKKGVDHRLNEEKGALKTSQKEAEHAARRLAQIPKDREEANHRIVDPKVPESEKMILRQKLDNLLKEEDDLTFTYDQKTKETTAISQKIIPIQEESDLLQKQIDTNKADQHREISALDQHISDIRKEIEACSQKLRELDNDKRTHFQQLGQQIAANPLPPTPNLAAEAAAVHATQKDIADLHLRLAHLEQEKNDVGERAFRNMVLLIVVGVLSLIAIIVVLVLLLSPKPQRTVREQQGHPQEYIELKKPISKNSDHGRTDFDRQNRKNKI